MASSIESPLNRVVVIGASEGGVPALVSLVQALSDDLAAAVLIVVHNRAVHSQLPRLLAHSGLGAGYARHGDTLSAGKVFIAPPDEHLLLDGVTVRLARGPQEHHNRPAIDPLFRSAALAFETSVVGIVLTGELDDGVSGLQAIKLLGGTTVVQEPSEAFEPSMPRSALEACEVDHCLPIALIAMLLNDLCRYPAAPLPADRRPSQQQLAALRSASGIQRFGGEYRGLPEGVRDALAIYLSRLPRWPLGGAGLATGAVSLSHRPRVQRALAAERHGRHE